MDNRVGLQQDDGKSKRRKNKRKSILWLWLLIFIAYYVFSTRATVDHLSDAIGRANDKTEETEEERSTDNG